LLFFFCIVLLPLFVFLILYWSGSGYRRPGRGWWGYIFLVSLLFLILTIISRWDHRITLRRCRPDPTG
jgi:hypothetical protein